MFKKIFKSSLILTILIQFNIYAFELPKLNLFSDKENEKTEVEKYCAVPKFPENKDINTEKFKIFEIKLNKFNNCALKYLSKKLLDIKKEKIKSKNYQLKQELNNSMEFLKSFNKKAEDYRNSVEFVMEKKIKYYNDTNRLKNGKSRKYVPEAYK